MKRLIVHTFYKNIHRVSIYTIVKWIIQVAKLENLLNQKGNEQLQLWKCQRLMAFYNIDKGVMMILFNYASNFKKVAIYYNYL